MRIRLLIGRVMYWFVKLAKLEEVRIPHGSPQGQRRAASDERAIRYLDERLRASK